jgi:hypothetical protein
LTSKLEVEVSLNRWTLSLVLVAAFAASACQFFGPSTSEMTLGVQNQVLNTEIAAIRATATVEADRLIVTLEHAQTAVSQVNGQTQDLQATIGAQGLPPVDLSSISPVPDSVFATPPPIVEMGPTQMPGIAPIGITPGPTSAVIIPNQNNAALVLPTIPAQGGNTQALVTQQDTGPLQNIVTTSTVGADDCAINPSNSFTTSNNEIYVVARAVGVAANDNITSRWSTGGTEIVLYDWTPGFAIQDACIWFYISQPDITFTPGSWQVQMGINGQPVGAPVAFTIAGAAAAGDAALEGALSGSGG